MGHGWAPAQKADKLGIPWASAPTSRPPPRRTSSPRCTRSSSSERGLRHQASWDEDLDGNTGTPDLITARDALRWATIDGAKVAGLAGHTGSITPGKKADLVIIDGSARQRGPDHRPGRRRRVRRGHLQRARRCSWTASSASATSGSSRTWAAPARTSSGRATGSSSRCPPRRPGSRRRWRADRRAPSRRSPPRPAVHPSPPGASRTDGRSPHPAPRRRPLHQRPRHGRAVARRHPRPRRTDRRGRPVPRGRRRGGHRAWRPDGPAGVRGHAPPHVAVDRPQHRGRLDADRLSRRPALRTVEALPPAGHVHRQPPRGAGGTRLRDHDARRLLAQPVHARARRRGHPAQPQFRRPPNRGRRPTPPTGAATPSGILGPR